MIKLSKSGKQRKLCCQMIKLISKSVIIRNQTLIKVGKNSGRPIKNVKVKDDNSIE